MLEEDEWVEWQTAVLMDLLVSCVVWTDAPRLSDISVDGEDFDSLLKSFVCHSTPAATKARLDHAAQLRLVDQPWWCKLGDDYQDSKFTVDDSVDDGDDDSTWKVF